MSYTDFKEITNPTAGTTVKYGSQDLLDIMQILNGKVVGNRRPHIINPWRWDASQELKETTPPANPAAGYQAHWIDSTTHRPSWKDSLGSTLDVGTRIPYNRRWGSFQPAAGTAANTVGTIDGILSQHTVTGATFSDTYDTSEGILANLVSGAVAGNNAGLISPTVGVGVGRRLFGMKAEARFSMTNTANGRLFFGFTSATAPPNNAQPLATTDNGVYVGYNETGTGSTNWSIFHNDGATSVTVDNVGTGVPKDTQFHTVIIQWVSSGSLVIAFDAITQTIVADIPITTANLFFNLYAQASTTTAKTLLIDYVYVEAEK